MLQFPFDIPDNKKIRLIINSDAKNEADDQFAIVHALLTPQFIVKGVIGAHFGEYRTNTSMQESYEEIVKVVELMDLNDEISVYKGADRALPDEQTPVMSEGAELIIREAFSSDPHPLFVIFLGPITDLAAAFLREPSIANKLTAIWVGGGPWPNGGHEYNLSNDINAANIIFRSNIQLWVVPQNVYSTIKVSISELAVRVKPFGDIGDYLYQQLVDFNLGPWAGWTKGEMWSMGDSTAVALLMDDHAFGYEWRPAPRISTDMWYVHEQQERLIRWYHHIDPRFTLEDMYAKLKIHYGNKL
ncbi:nucleoside hydrolase [Paenibacillus sp. GCM10027628]|uniref:nucleoside hydrolase n=1 Tax=Paenibacillus sp. GCM10027628 TaxID=3273413 RepID=UPI003625BCBA